MAPYGTPNVNPDKNIVTDINSRLGTSMNMKPKPMAIAAKIAARTNLFRFIFFEKWDTEIVVAVGKFS